MDGQTDGQTETGGQAIATRYSIYAVALKNQISQKLMCLR